ncbi:MAG: RNase III inhibitor, partial [Leptolyngbya sp. SIO3F4]|nr:RNase III inhibitor [Leptolyngbya sp. SIO3F4]
YPINQAAAIAIQTVQDFLQQNDILDNVIFACFGDSVYQTYLKILDL